MMKTIGILLVFLSTQVSLASNFVFEEDFSLPIVYINITTDVGAVNDPAAKLGLSSVAGRMMLRGTQKHSKKRFFEIVELLGGSVEVQVQNEGTIFRVAILSENLEKFLELFEEALTLPQFSKEELAKVKKEVEGEILEHKGNDMQLVSYNFLRFFYGTHPYGNPLSGTQKGVATITLNDVETIFREHYGAPTLALFGTGAAKQALVEAWFNKVVEKLQKLHPNATRSSEVTTPNIQRGRETLLVDKPKATQAQVLIGGTGLRPEDPGFYAVQLANFSFGGGSFSSRLMKELRVKRGWTYGAYSSFRFGRKPRHFTMYFFPKTDDTPPAIQTALDLFNDYLRNGITRAEFDFARKSLVNNAPFNYDTSKKRLENETQEYLLQFPHDYFRNFAHNIENVSYEEIGPSLKLAFNPQNLKLALVGDASKLKDKIAKIPGIGAISVKSYLQD